MPREPVNPWASVRVILPNEQGCLGDELIAVTGYSLQRALDAVEGTLDPNARRRITRELISPLERARHSLRVAMAHPGSHQRIAVVGDVAELCHKQYSALWLALQDPRFPHEDLPAALSDPVAACERFERAAGLTLAPVASHAQDTEVTPSAES
jgi:hypothetical protein